MKRRVAVVTGTRAEYGLLRTVCRAMRAEPTLEIELFVTGMHLLRRFGATVREIERDPWPIAARVRMQRGDDAPLDQAEGLARGVAGLARAFARRQPDIVLVLGDRIEALAGALAAVTSGRILAHVHGGDVAEGDFDDSLRHAITKLAHLHFAASSGARRRLLALGERPDCVFRVGAPGLDELRELRTVAHAAQPPTALVVQHAYGRSALREQRVMSEILACCAAAGLRRTIIWPNSDRGFAGVVSAIEAHVARSPAGSVRVARSLPRGEFLRELVQAEVLVGNSSCGLIEAPFAGTPAVNVGQRQAGREAGGPLVLHAEENAGAIGRTLRRARALRADAARRRRMMQAARVYGQGRAGEAIARILASCELRPGLRRKRLRLSQAARG